MVSELAVISNWGGRESIPEVAVKTFSASVLLFVNQEYMNTCLLSSNNLFVSLNDETLRKEMLVKYCISYVVTQCLNIE